MLVPLFKRLKADGHRLTILLDSPYLSTDFILSAHFPIDTVIDISGSGKKIAGFFKMIRSFDLIYLDSSNASMKNMFLAFILSKNRIVARNKKTPFFLAKNRYLDEHIHASILNKLLHDKKEYKLELEEMHLNDYNPSKSVFSKFQLQAERKKIFIQISAGNAKTPFKNWPINYWRSFLLYISEEHPDYQLLLIGDKNEIEYGEKIDLSAQPGIFNLIGKTSLSEAMEILFHSELYLGLDSGFMHMAVALNKPTFSIFGASSFAYVGYEQFDKNKHRTLHNETECWPCHGLISVNESRVKKAKQCPDFKCIKGISPDWVYDMFIDFLK